MKFQEFIKVYNSLNEHHRKIAFQILYLMDRNYKHPSQNKAVYDKVKEKQKKLNIGYAELNRKVAEQEEAKGLILSDKTYESVIRRKAIKTPIFEDIRQTLKLSEEEIGDIMLSAQYSDQVNIEWLFESLSHKNQNAICALANLLLIEETSPEYFDPYSMDDE